MKIFALVNGSDTAGTHYRLFRAFRAHGGPDWELRAMCAGRNYIEYPEDLVWDVLELERRYDAADVIHMSHFLFGHDNYDAGQGKPTIIVHHGLNNYTEIGFHGMVGLARDAGMVQLASTYDMVVYEPELLWQPTPYNLDWLREIRRAGYWPDHGGERPEGAPLRIVHAPTNREIKGTPLLLEAIRRIQQDGYKIELVMPERATWAQTLAAIATADLAFDQPYLGIGCFAVECMGMGLPVIAGVVDDKVRDGMREHWGALPFFHTEPSVASIVSAIMQLFDPFGREIYAGLGTTFVERYHAERKVVERLKPIYESAGPTKPGGWTRRVTRPGGELRRPLSTRKPIRGKQIIRVRR